MWNMITHFLAFTGGMSASVVLMLNILVARNHESGNLEIGVPVLRNRLFCA